MTKSDDALCLEQKLTLMRYQVRCRTGYVNSQKEKGKKL